MSVRACTIATLLVLLASSCGRIGYDEIPGLGGGSPGGSTGGATSGRDSGNANGGSDSGGSGGAPGGQTAAGGTGAGAQVDGGNGFSGASSDGAAGQTQGSGGALGGGGTTASDGAAGSGGVVGSGGTPGTGGAVVLGDAGVVGCADGQREGFLDMTKYPSIAACAGGFALPGVLGLTAPACGRTAGNDGANPNGAGCSALDLCAVGFHICSGGAEVAQKSATGCAGSAVGVAPVFFITAQHSNGTRNCTATGTDDAFGCGSLGSRPVSSSNCAPLDRWATNLCMALTAPWSCGTDQAAEAANVVKPGPGAGGVLCCRD